MRLRSGSNYVSPHPVQKPPSINVARFALTAKNLHAFDRNISPEKTPSSSSASRVTATNPAFPARLRKCRIRFLDMDTVPPKDIDVVTASLYQSRSSTSPTASPTAQDFYSYANAIHNCHNEASMSRQIWGILSKSRVARDYGPHFDLGWTKTDNFTHAGVSNPQPDVSESYTLTSYSDPVYDTMYLLLAINGYDVALPSFAGEFKGRRSLTEATYQAAYDGATMVAAWIDVLNAADIPYEGTTLAITFICDGDMLKIFASHAVDDEFHHYRLATLHPTESLDQFKQARTLLRNAQDWAYTTQTNIKAALEHHFASLSNLAKPTSTPATKPAPKSRKRKTRT